MKLLIVALSVILLTGCVSYSIPSYSPAAQTTSTIRSFGDLKISVGEFKSAIGEQPALRQIMCRKTAAITAPGGNTFAEYIRDALISELAAADVYDPRASVILSGRVDVLDFSSSIGRWSVVLSIASNNGHIFTISETYDYQTSYFGDVACIRTAGAAVGLVQGVIRKAMADRRFQSLLE